MAEKWSEELDAVLAPYMLQLQKVIRESSKAPEVHVEPPKVVVPPISVPKIEVPPVKIPEIRIPEIKIPQIPAPQVTVNVERVKVDGLERVERLLEREFPSEMRFSNISDLIKPLREALLLAIQKTSSGGGGGGAVVITPMGTKRTPAAPATITGGATGTQVVAFNRHRKSLLIRNAGSNTLYLGKDATATSSVYTAYLLAGESLEDNETIDAWFGNCTTGLSTTVSYEEAT